MLETAMVHQVAVHETFRNRPIEVVCIDVRLYNTDYRVIGFYRATAMLSAVYAVVVCLCLSVCLSVCVCVCLSHSAIVSKRLNVGSRQ